MAEPNYSGSLDEARVEVARARSDLASTVGELATKAQSTKRTARTTVRVVLAGAAAAVMVAVLVAVGRRMRSRP